MLVNSKVFNHVCFKESGMFQCKEFRKLTSAMVQVIDTTRTSLTLLLLSNRAMASNSSRMKHLPSAARSNIPKLEGNTPLLTV